MEIPPRQSPVNPIVLTEINPIPPLERLENHENTIPNTIPNTISNPKNVQKRNV